MVSERVNDNILITSEKNESFDNTLQTRKQMYKAEELCESAIPDATNWPWHNVRPVQQSQQKGLASKLK